MEQKSRVFLVHFLKKWKYLDFCIPELVSLADMFGVPAEQLQNEKSPIQFIDIKKSPFIYVNLPNEDVAKKIMERSVLIREIINVLSQEKNSYENLVKNIDSIQLQEVLNRKQKFRFIIEGIGKKISNTQQRDIIKMFGHLPFDEKLVDLKNYETVFKIIENEEDGQIYFGNRVANCRPKGDEDDTYYSKYSLKLRPYLGPTSTDHELALLMANQGQVSVGDFVYDPFVGTGSIAVALQHFGAFIFGSDLDIRVLKGYGVGRKTKNDIKDLDKIQKFDITTNFSYYNLPIPDFWVQDIQVQMVRNNRAIFDSIVCDPPYGVRARAQKVGIKESKLEKYEEKKAKQAQQDDEIEEQKNEEEDFHASMKVQYQQNDIYADLLQNASQLLKKGGRIVFLYHTDDQLSQEENKFPSHPQFKFICSSKDILTKFRARHLITMQKL